MTTPADTRNDRPSAAARPRLAVISAGISDPSSTRMLADRIAQRSLELLDERGAGGSVRIIELAPLALDIARRRT
jgi:FMN reductase